MIPTAKLFPHPDNPRKDVGDVTELAESIKARGIMQNLTVIPLDRENGLYTVIIGHRRLAASKLAGLKEVPCAIAEMTDKEQLATMLLENMQRADLTLYEQAQGMQMMIDLGETVKDIAEKTGFSETTVRRRVKLNRYDADIMRDIQVRQPTMEQYMALAEIEDESVANDCLRLIGTKNFDNAVASAIRRQREAKQRAAAIEVIEKYAEKLADTSYQFMQAHKYVNVLSCYDGKVDEDKLRDLKKKHGKLYYGASYGFTVYRDPTDEDDKISAERDAKREARAELEGEADGMYSAMKERALAWIEGYVPRKGHLERLTEALYDAFISDFGTTNYFWGLHEKLGGAKPDDYYARLRRVEAEAFMLEKYEESREKTMLFTLWYIVKKNTPASLRYNSTKLENDRGEHNHLMWLFSLLSDLGYNVSDDEWAFISGSHPIYSKEVPL